MTKILELTAITGHKVTIVVSKITGIVETNKNVHARYGKCYIATGADSSDGGENGWYVAESYETVKVMLNTA